MSGIEQFDGGTFGWRFYNWRGAAERCQRCNMKTHYGVIDIRNDGREGLEGFRVICKYCFYELDGEVNNVQSESHEVEPLLDMPNDREGGLHDPPKSFFRRLASRFHLQSLCRQQTPARNSPL